MYQEQILRHGVEGTRDGMHEIEETDRLTEAEESVGGKRIENVNFFALPSVIQKLFTSPFKCLSPLRSRKGFRIHRRTATRASI